MSLPENDSKMKLKPALALLFIVFLVAGLFIAMGQINKPKTLNNRASSDIPAPCVAPTNPVTTPKPTLVVYNNPPQIATVKVAEGVIGKKYTAKFYAYDRDVNDSVDMKITTSRGPLSDTFGTDMIDSCRKWVQTNTNGTILNRTECIVSGIPQKAFDGLFIIQASDTKNGFMRNSVSLKVIAPTPTVRVSTPTPLHCSSETPKLEANGITRTARDLNNDTVTINWADFPKASSYFVLYSVDNGTTFTSTLPVSSSFTTTVGKDYTLHFSIQARINGCSDTRSVSGSSQPLSNRQTPTTRATIGCRFNTNCAPGWSCLNGKCTPPTNQ